MTLQTKVDEICWRTWVLQAAGFFLLATLLLITVAAASVESTGLPCYYAALTDYSLRNVSMDGGSWGQDGEVGPVLFTEPPTTAAFFVFMTLVFLIVALCALVLAARIRRESRKKRALQPHVSTLVMLSGSPLVLFLGALLVWILQTVILLLAHKLIALAAMLFLLHACLLIPFFAYYCGSGFSWAEYQEVLATLRGSSARLLRTTQTCKAVNVNLLGGVLALVLAMAALLLGQLMAHGLHLSFWACLIVAIVMFAITALTWMVLVELVFSKYVQMLVGPAFGVLVAAGGIGVAFNHYTTLLKPVMQARAPFQPLLLRLLLALVGLAAVFMITLRLVRAYLYHRQKNSAFYGRVMRVKDTATRYVKKHAKGLTSHNKKLRLPPPVYDEVPGGYGTEENSDAELWDRGGDGEEETLLSEGPDQTLRKSKTGSYYTY